MQEYTKEDMQAAIRRLETEFEQKIAAGNIHLMVDVALVDVHMHGKRLPVGFDNLPFEVWLAALGNVLVCHGYSMESFIQKYNAVCGDLPKITTESWFREVNKEPSENRLSVQFGVHLEEVREMFPEISSGREGIDAKMALIDTLLKEVAHEFKTGGATLQIVNRKKFFDSLLDQRVTGTGTAQYAGFNLSEGMARVDLSNFTKFVDGTVLFKQGGKVDKGPCFTEPDLSGLEG